MDRDAVRPGAGEVGDVALGPLDHQVDVEVTVRAVHLVGERRHHLRAHAEGGHEVAVHHVDVDRARAGVEHRGDLLAQAREVGGQDGGRDAARQVAGHQIGWSIELRQWLQA